MTVDTAGARPKTKPSLAVNHFKSTSASSIPIGGMQITKPVADPLTPQRVKRDAQLGPSNPNRYKSSIDFGGS